MSYDFNIRRIKMIATYRLQPSFVKPMSLFPVTFLVILKDGCYRINYPF